ncbi:DUF2945 domain-containing protein [Streptomyces sp. NPDC058576]|uniref:DUF2945 domain-containing protein n=1 Tax=Streptomyces sp. NPDC058576 TaxID=3346547 RepID=UPI00365AA4FA
MVKARKNLSQGLDVSWQSHGHDVERSGTRKVDERTEATGEMVGASLEEPQYEVKCAKTEKRAVHRPESLTRKKNRGGS